MIVRDRPTGYVLTYRGNKYDQWTHKRGEYPANMWLTYRNVRYRPASLKYHPAFLPQQGDKDRSGTSVW